MSDNFEKIQISREYDTPGWISQSKQSIPISDWRAEPLSFHLEARSVFKPQSCIKSAICIHDSHDVLRPPKEIKIPQVLSIRQRFSRLSTPLIFLIGTS